MHDYRKLDVWTRAHELALDVHRAAWRTPRALDLECTAEVARVARAIPARIVRGCESETAEDFADAMRDAAIAVDEFAYRLRFVRDADLLDAVPFAKLEARAQRLRAMLGGLHRTVRIRMGVGRRGARRERAEPTDRSAPETRVRSAVAQAMRGVRDGGSSPRESRR